MKETKIIDAFAIFFQQVFEIPDFDGIANIKSKLSEKYKIFGGFVALKLYLLYNGNRNFTRRRTCNYTA